MKKKIGAVAFLTITVFGLSFLLLAGAIRSFTDEAVIQNYNGNVFDNHHVTGSSIELPVYKPRKNISASYARENFREYSAFSVSETFSDRESYEKEAFLTSEAMLSDRVNSVSYSKQGRNSNENSLSAGIPVLKKIRSPGSEKLYTSNRISDREVTRLVLSQPFSGAGLHGPMRMDGDNSNPPAEGVPAGEGVAILMLLSVAYGVFQIFRVKAVS